MLELDPAKLPAFADLEADPMDYHNGPTGLDAESVGTMVQRISDGMLAPFTPEQVAEVAALEPEDFEPVLREKLDGIHLSARSSTIFDARALALHQTFQHFVGVARQPVEDALDAQALDLYLAQAVAGLPSRFTVEQRRVLADTVMMLSPDELAAALRLDIGRLQSWRINNQGPRFLKGVSARNSVRYPVAAVAEWLASL